MPVIKLYNADLENLTGVSIERIKERLPLLCADVERIESDSLDVEFFPNRPDLFSVEGVARTMKQFLDIKPGLATYNVDKSGIEMVVETSVLEVRPYIVCGVVRDLHFDSSTIESLMLLQEHLHRGIGRNRAKVSVGVHDLGKVKPPFRYLAVDPGFSFVPLDYEEEMSMAEILERHPKGVAYKYILEDKTNYPLILDSRGGVISFPPIINAERTRVTESTTDIFLDVTGLDDNVSVALNIIACALAERGGQLQSVVLRYPDAEMETPSLAPKTMETSVADVNSLTGLELSAEDCKKCCERMGLSAKLKLDGRLDVIIPAYRSDILHPWDIIEDIAIGYGYDRIKPDIPGTMVIGAVHPIEDKKRQVREIMTGFGYFEVLTFTLTSERKQFELMLRKRHEEEEVQVASPISTEHTMLRSTIMPNLLEILALNQHRDLPQRIFEVGPVLLNIKEKYRLAAVSTHANANFAEVRSVVDSVLKEMCMDEVELSESEDGAFLAGRRADIKVDGKRIGVFGELHPAVILNFGLDHPVVGFEVGV
uniref:Phenylalanine--tRNA ligase beta subunit n=1 Tax=Uncultured archaeon GZfos26G2 TaxID=3386331 RepID=Q64DQ0_UNCAG|nr:phenylalanyl-tRNA synthetase beta subunit [uncultured archaeon GZfos17G11]